MPDFQLRWLIFEERSAILPRIQRQDVETSI